jgi:osmotically-inducible protein OsmY
MNDVVVSREDIYELHSLQGDGLTEVRAEQLATLLRAEQRDDRDVCREVQRALTLDRFVPLSVDAQVLDGIVVLTGSVSRPTERDDALVLASCVPGVVGISDELVMNPAPRPGDA